MKDPKLIVSEAYDQVAERYLEWRARQPREGELARWLGLLREYVRPGARVLDIGCGAGIPLTLALSKSFDVTGVDISVRQIELAVRNIPEASFIQGDVTTLDFAPASFDAAVASYSLIHVPRAEHVGVFRSVARWLRPNGILLANFGASRRLTSHAVEAAKGNFSSLPGALAARLIQALIAPGVKHCTRCRRRRFMTNEEIFPDYGYIIGKSKVMVV